MGRKVRSTEVNEIVSIKSNGQHMRCLMFCVNCYGVGHHETHYPDCTKHESYAIPSTAEVPRKNASNRIWRTFKKQFVYINPGGWWFHSDRSWYYKNKINPEAS